MQSSHTGHCNTSIYSAVLASCQKEPFFGLLNGGDQLLGEDVAIAEIGQRDLDVTRAADRQRPALLRIPPRAIFALPVAAAERDLALFGAGQAALWQHAAGGCPVQEVLQPLLRKTLLVPKDRPAAESGVD